MDPTYLATLETWAERVGLGQDDVASFYQEFVPMIVRVTACSRGVDVYLWESGLGPEAFAVPALAPHIRAIDRRHDGLRLRFAVDVDVSVLDLVLEVAEAAVRKSGSSAGS